MVDAGKPRTGTDAGTRPDAGTPTRNDGGVDAGDGSRSDAGAGTDPTDPFGGLLDRLPDFFGDAGFPDLFGDGAGLPDLFGDAGFPDLLGP